MSDRVTSAFEELPPLPDVAMRLIRAINDARAGSDAIVGILRTDASLTAEVLRRANSPVYGLAAKVSSASQAVMLLGTDEIRRLTMTISLDKHFGGAQRSMRRLWRHAFARALVAERLADVTGLGSEGAYTAGLLADIGIYGLMVSFPETELRIIELAHSIEAVLQMEEREFGVNHCQAGGWLARQWRLPDAIVAAVIGHHDKPPAVGLGGVVNWADATASCLAFGFLGQSQAQADLEMYHKLRRDLGAAADALPQDAEELFSWLVARVPA